MWLYHKGSGPGIEVTATEQGMRITRVRPDSPAGRLGLEEGDVIVAVYGRPVTSAEAWARLLSGDDAYVRLSIRDARTGVLLTRYAPLD